VWLINSDCGPITHNNGTRLAPPTAGDKCKKNKNVSVSPLSRQDKIFHKALMVDTSLQSKHGNSKSVCWNYYGTLMYDSGDNKKPCAIDNRILFSVPC